jgi:hypothetical protein
MIVFRVADCAGNATPSMYRVTMPPPNVLTTWCQAPSLTAYGIVNTLSFPELCPQAVIVVPPGFSHRPYSWAAEPEP